MQLISQNPTDEDFIQDPYKFYKNFVSTDGLYYWNEYNMPAVFDPAGQELLFKDKRFGREKLKNQSNNHEKHLKAFYHVESNSMLELEPPKHTRLRGLVLRAFTTRKINTIQPEIAALSYKLLDDLKSNNVDILKGFATQLPVIVIARLLLTNVKDSKKLSAKKREEIFSMVEENNIEYSFNESSNTFIDQFGIKNANEKVLTDSISDIYTGNEIVYVDHFKINDFKSISVVRGEDNCRAIALASIIAKVLRDNLMVKFSEKYPEYSFEKNKGYGTKDHREAISKYGLSNIHRKSFSLKPI